MSKRAELIKKYSADLIDKCGVIPNMDLLERVTIGCGPAIYNADSSMVSSSSESEISTVKTNFLIKKLGLNDSSRLDRGIQKVFEQYGMSNRQKYRAVVYYLLTVHFKKESIYLK